MVGIARSGVEQAILVLRKPNNVLARLQFVDLFGTR